ncbi:hypothetical protein AALO_G00272420 [Alosa alosa]|uniref:Tumor protein p53-inducible protein 11 n=1 Tax=Alosa alosa TaxID=278164 RepID=A0AAV6FSG2_9TELE|nr:hypothetical protein AALO_G00272420 [Alosa alosa]
MATSAPPPLMKKHSQTDLVSRLKTRKVLGVGGEDDDGEVHRSKISQVLGNESKYAVREPIGLRVWIFLSAVLFTLIAVMPTRWCLKTAPLTASIRLYGGALLSISLIMWNGLYTAEKAVMQWTLLTEASYCGVQFLVTSMSLLEVGFISDGALCLLLGEVLVLLVTLLYHHQLGRRVKKM